MGILLESEVDQLLKFCLVKLEKKFLKLIVYIYVNKLDLIVVFQEVIRLGGGGKIKVV